MHRFINSSSWWQRIATFLLAFGLLAVPAHADEDKPAGDVAEKEEADAGEEEKEEQAPKTIEWIKGLEDGLKAAKEGDKLVFVYFGRENPG